MFKDNNKHLKERRPLQLSHLVVLLIHCPAGIYLFIETHLIEKSPKICLPGVLAACDSEKMGDR